MVVLSPHFAALACLCAAVPLVLPHPAAAAHLYSGHLMAKHASSPPPRSPDDSLTHSYVAKQHGHEASHRRGPGLPLPLRRYRAHDHLRIENHQGRDPHDHAHPKTSRSAFARSRYRRESSAHSRRSSVYVPGDHGDTYLVTRTPLTNSDKERAGTDRRSSNAYNRRQHDESNLVMGRIDIMGAAQLSNSTQRLASLTVDSTPIDWKSGQTSFKAFQLNASMTNQTQFIMMPMDQPSDAGGNLNKHITLATEVFDASSAELVMYCATYNPDPGSTSPLLMTPCTGETQSVAPANDAADPCSDAANDAFSSNAYQSQIFSYDPSSGKIEPISTTASPSTVDSSDDQTRCAGERVRRANGNPTTSSSTTASSTATSTARTATASQMVRNVTLVYVPGALEVPVSSSSASGPTSASAAQGPVVTTTITTTVVATTTATDSSSRTPTPPKAAVSVSTSSTSTTTSPSITASPSPASSSSSTSSSPTTTATSKAPARAEESLEVEVVGMTPTTTASSSSTSSTTTITMTATTSTSSSVGPSRGAQAVASSIANEVM